MMLDNDALFSFWNNAQPKASGTVGANKTNFGNTDSK